MYLQVSYIFHNNYSIYKSNKNKICRIYKFCYILFFNSLTLEIDIIYAFSNFRNLEFP